MLATHLFAAALAFPGNKFDVKAITDRNKKSLLLSNHNCAIFTVMQLFPTNSRNHRWHRLCKIMKDNLLKQAGIWQTLQS